MNLPAMESSEPSPPCAFLERAWRGARTELPPPIAPPAPPPICCLLRPSARNGVRRDAQHELHHSLSGRGDDCSDQLGSGTACAPSFLLPDAGPLL